MKRSSLVVLALLGLALVFCLSALAGDEAEADKASVGKKKAVFKDPGLELAVRMAIFKEEGDIMQDGLSGLGDLMATNQRIASTQAIGQLPSLTYLHLGHNKIKDLTPLAELKKLDYLVVSANLVEDLSPLVKMESLVIVEAEYNKIKDIAPVKDMERLTTLYLSGNSVSDLSVLAGCTALVELTISFTEVSDLSPLAGLTKLKKLLAAKARIEDVGPLVELQKAGGLKPESFVDLRENPLSEKAKKEDVPYLLGKMVIVLVSGQ